MRVSGINNENVYSNTKKQKNDYGFSMPIQSWGVKLAPQINSDRVSFTANAVKILPKQKMTTYAIKFLESINLQENQPLHITAEAKHIPFVKILSDEAYKKGSGVVEYNIIEPEIEAIKNKHGITETFDYIKDKITELKQKGAAFVSFDETNNPYKASGLSKKEAKEQIQSVSAKIPKKIQKIFQLDPEEIFKTALDMHEGEPIVLRGEREHVPQIVRLVDYLVSKNKTRVMDVRITELKEFDSKVSLLKHGKDELIGKHLQSTIDSFKEGYEKDSATLVLRGADPEFLKGLDSNRIVKHQSALGKAVEEYYNKHTANNPWLCYYYPTSRAAIKTYPEYGDNQIAALEHALKDAKKINRAGKLQQHVKTLQHRATKMNELLEKGFRNIHFVSVDPITKQPDKKTDLIIGLSPKSFFSAARHEMKATGHNPIVNIPTEEIFTSPQANTAEGHVRATMPLVLNGQVVEGIKFTNHKGKITDIQADSNLKMLKQDINSNRGAKYYGEVALVADSPIFKLNRLYFSTLIDENATCHIAYGDAYPSVVKGPKGYHSASEMEDYQKLQKYLKKEHINSSTTHNDVMIGGPDVYVFAENPKTGESILVIKDDKFLL